VVLPVPGPPRMRMSARRPAATASATRRPTWWSAASPAVPSATASADTWTPASSHFACRFDDSRENNTGGGPVAQVSQFTCRWTAGPYQPVRAGSPPVTPRAPPGSPSCGGRRGNCPRITVDIFRTGTGRLIVKLIVGTNI
jgi:hypothetical protein